MQFFRTKLTVTKFIGICIVTGLVTVPHRIEASMVAPLSIDFIKMLETSASSSDSIRVSSGKVSTEMLEDSAGAILPEWLQILDLNEAQIRHMLEIDALLEQRLQSILTSDQYSQWRSSQINLSDATENETWTFADINIDLSSYQQVAVDAAFRDSFQSVIAILSVEQNQRLLQYLSEENTLPESGLDI